MRQMSTSCMITFIYKVIGQAHANYGDRSEQWVEGKWGVRRLERGTKG